jgi:nicotinate-nucleotide--dimethylbenzimidazole phosphoribosyltransferase
MNAPIRFATIEPTADPQLERALQDRLSKLAEQTGGLGELEPLAIRLGLMQATLAPRLESPQLVLVASDHGLAVDGLHGPMRLDTTTTVNQVLNDHMPVSRLARLNGLALQVVDAGVADALPPNDRLTTLKQAFGTRNTRMGPAMSVDQANECIRLGMEFARPLPGKAVLCAGIGVGSRESAALVLSRLTDTPVRDLFYFGPHYSSARVARLMGIAQGALGRHPEAHNPIEVLAALGGFEMAVLVGVQLAAAEQRRLLVVDGLSALAALLVASRLAPAVSDYCVFSRSQTHPSLDNALGLFRASAILEMGMDSLDGTGAALAWPLINSAAELLCRTPGASAEHVTIRNKR